MCDLASTARCGRGQVSANPADSNLELTGHLLEMDNDELRRLQRCEAHEDVDDAAVAIILGRRLLVALHEIRVARGGPLEGTLAEEPVHERAHVQANLRPQRLVV